MKITTIVPVLASLSSIFCFDGWPHGPGQRPNQNLEQNDLFSSGNLNSNSRYFNKRRKVNYEGGEKLYTKLVGGELNSFF